MMRWLLPSSYSLRERREIALQVVAIAVAILMWVAASTSERLEDAPPFGDPADAREHVR